MSIRWNPGRPGRPLPIVAAALALLAVVAPRTALAAAPANDNYAGATGVSTIPFTDTVDTTEATTEPGEQQYCAFLSQTVWYSITPGSDTILNAVGSGSASPVNVTVYLDNGAGIGGLSFIGCGTYSNPVAFRAKRGSTYRFQVGPSFGGTGTVTLQVGVVPTPTNDNFAGATPVTALPFSTTADLTAASAETGEPTPSCGQQPQATIWFTFTPSASRSYTLNLNAPFSPAVGVYTGSSLGSLVQVGCSTSFSPLTFHAEAGKTYFLQIGTTTSQLIQGSPAFILLEVNSPPNVFFGLNPFDPSTFDTIQFAVASSDPAGIGLGPDQWSFGDGTTAIGPPGGCCPYTTHKYAADGDYTVTLVSTTLDGRSASYTQVVHVRTHDVVISKFTVPETARAGQTRSISVGVTNSRYPETVQLALYKSSSYGFQLLTVLNQPVPVGGGNHATTFDFNYTFTADDAAAGKATFSATATIINARDAIPGNNTVIALATKVSK